MNFDNNFICVTGNLGQDPQIRTFEKSRKAVVTLAQSQGKDKQTVWWKLECWGYDADALMTCRKGMRVRASGEPGEDFWEDQNTGEARSQKVIRNCKIAIVPDTRRNGDRYEDEF